MAMFPNGYNMVPNGMGYTMQPVYQGVNYQTGPQGLVPPSQQYQIPQPQQGLVPQVLNGKVVESFEVFKACDIPMDGGTYYFPKADGSEVYSKRWMENGKTEQVVYKRVLEEPSEETKKFVSEAFVGKTDIDNLKAELFERFDSVIDRVKSLEEAFK